MPNGNVDKLKKLQVKRAKLEKALLVARARERVELNKKLRGVNSLIVRIVKKGGQAPVSLKKLQDKRKQLEKDLLSARAKDKEDVRRKIRGLNSMIDRLMRKEG